MKKFTVKNVLEGLRSSVTQPVPKIEQHALIEETLKPEFFQVAKTVRAGFPYQPTSVAFDPIQKLLAVGTKHGSIRLLGTPGVDVHMQHEGDSAVLQILFLPNAGALVSATVDDSIHLWSFKQKKPEVVHTLKFQRERITCIHLPFKSKFLYVGTERGNIFVVNIEVFQLSGYIINWNKAIELSRKTHPGPVVHLSDCPVDPNKLLIGYESGQIVIWDLRLKVAESRYQSTEPLRSISWHHEGKQFMCSHTDGSLTTWMIKQVVPKATSTIFPHAKMNKEGKQETCKIIHKVEWTSSKNGDSFVIFSGGLTNDRTGRTPSITVIHGKTTTVLEMEHNVIDFITLCETPWQYDFAEPYALIVLLNNDLVVVDLQSPGYPCFENPYSMDFHESPVTSCCYIADCPADLIPALYCIGGRSQKRSGFSDRDWPICGGKWGTSCSYSELIVTGHADGSLKFWDVSSVIVQILYKLKTAKIFEKPRTKSIDGDEDPFAVHHIALCPVSRLLCVAGATSHVICFKYCKQENTAEVPCLEIPIVYEVADSSEMSPDAEFPTVQQQTSLEYFLPIHVKGGVQKKNPGYQAELVCLTPWVNGEPPGTISGISINSSYGVLAYGNESGLVIVDYIQKVCLLSMGTPELYGAADPYQRAPRSPKKPESNKDKDDDRCKSPSSDQREEETDLFAVVGHIERKPNKKPDDTQRGGLKRMSSKICDDFGKNPDSVCEKFPPKDIKGKAKVEIKNADEPTNERGTDEYDEIGNDVMCLDDINLTDIDAVSSHSPCPEVNTIKTELDPPHHKPTLQDMKSKSECLEFNKKNRFRFKNHLTKLDAKMRRAFSWENNGTNQSTEFYIKSQDEDYPIGEDPADDIPFTAEFRGSLAIPLHKDSKSPTLTPSGSGRSLLKCSPRSPRLTPSPRPSPLEEEPLEETQEEIKNAARTKFSLELFDKEGNPIPPLRLKSASSLSSEQKATTEEDCSQETGKLSFSSASSHSTNPFGTPGDEMGHTNHSSPVNRGTFRTFLSQLSKMGSSHALGDKLDSSTFSRSRSSSISSLDNITSEAIQCLAFADSYTKKNENQLCPTLWVGTSLGSVIQVLIFLPPVEARSTTPVNVTPSGTIFRLKGTILAMGFLDCNGALIPYAFESWKDAQRERKLERTPTRTLVNSRLSPTNSGEQTWGDRQFMVIASDKVARVVALPSHNCVYKQIITEVSFVVKAEIIQMKDAVCLVCYLGTGHLSIFSLPSLRQLTYIEFVPLTDLSFQTRKSGIVDPMLSIWGQQLFVNEDTNQIARTFCFTNYGHGMFLCSPSEIQKFTLSADFCKEMQDLMGNLFTQCETPEPPKQSFFKGIFGGGVSQVDRDELFGESSGKAARSVAKHIPGPNAAIEGINAKSTGVAAEVARTKMMLIEREVKLGQLDDQTAKMLVHAETYSNTAQGIMLKMKDKKWYQL